VTLDKFVEKEKSMFCRRPSFQNMTKNFDVCGQTRGTWWCIFSASSPNNAACANALRESARKLRTASFECIAVIVRALAICAWTSTGHQFSKLFAGEIDSSTGDQKMLTNGGDQRDQILCLLNENDRQLVPFESSVKAQAERTNSQELEVAVGIANKRGLKKAIDYLVASGALPPAPRAIATYLRMHKNRFHPAELGRYLGETGIDGAEKEYWNSIRHNFIRAISFLGMNLDEALWHFLTHCGFRLPGEAQKVDRIINTFAECFFEDNAGDVAICPFPNEDEVYLLSFAVIMLNTDLHKACERGRRGKNRMTKQDFIGNIWSAGQGENIPRNYLVSLYESIEKCPIVLIDKAEGTDPDDDGKRDLNDILNNMQGASWFVVLQVKSMILLMLTLVSIRSSIIMQNTRSVCRHVIGFLYLILELLDFPFQ
jgi:hypothetical protein